MTTHHGGHVLVDVLRRHGVEVVFGVVSIHNLPLVQAVAQELRFVPVRHEASAVNAADGYARATGGLGCALTSTGTGAGNACGSLIESLSAGTAVLHVTGQVESRFLGSGRGFIHETKDQAGMLAAVSKQMYTITSAAEGGEVLEQAAARALAAPAGPVSVEWPIDLQYAAQTHRPAPLVTADPVGLDPALVADVVSRLRAAERPVIWAGGGAAAYGKLLKRLLVLLGAGLFTSNSGRGAVPEDHELCVGNYATTPGGRALLADADLLLSLGTHFRSNETADYSLVVPTQHVQVDLDAAANGRVFPATTEVVSDIGVFLAAVVTELEKDPVPAGPVPAGPVPGGSVPDGPLPAGSWTDRVRTTRAVVRQGQRTGLGEHTVFADVLRKVLPRSAVVARDVTIASSSWGNRLLEFYDPRSNVFPRGGGIGQGLGMALGAALARPNDPTVCIVGDGGLAVHFGELMTLAQEQPWLVLMVFNDEGYGVLRNMQSPDVRAGVELTTPDFFLIGRSLGLAHRLIKEPGDVQDVLEEAVRLRAPVIVEVDLAAYPDMPHLFTPPVRVPGAEND